MNHKIKWSIKINSLVQAFFSKAETMCRDHPCWEIGTKLKISLQFFVEED